MPLSAAANGVTTVDQWTAQLRRSAVLLQSASLDLRHYGGWRTSASPGAPSHLGVHTEGRVDGDDPLA